MAIRTPAELKARILATYTDNDTGDILPIDARGFLDDAVDSFVPGHGGSPALDRLQWNSATGWTPVSDVTTQYLVANTQTTFDRLQTSLVRALTVGGSNVEIPDLPAFVSSRLSSYLVIGGPNTNGVDASLDEMWPVGQPPPFFWLATPTAYDRLERSRVTCWTTVDNMAAGMVEEDMRVIGRLPYSLLINGVPYELGRYLTSLARPVDVPATMGQAALRFRYRYAEPPPGAHEVEQVP